MSDVNAVIVQPFKQFVKARRAASKTSIAVEKSIAGTRPPRRACSATTLLRRCRAVARRITQHTRRAVAATQTRPPRRARSATHYCATHTRRRRAVAVAATQTHHTRRTRSTS